MSTDKLNQIEYLKRYLSGDKHESKIKSKNSTINIVDDDFNFKRRSNRSPDASPPRRRTKRSPGASPKRHENVKIRIDYSEKYTDNGGVVCDRKTGRHRRLHEQDKMDSEKLKKEEERKQVYDRWGKGLKQIENYKEQVASEMHEMNKPMARYANDADLEDHLRSQCRDGDPMAAYFRKKSNDLQSGPCKPMYHGYFPENRFNIRPGYHWDGVDRTNGYEKKWFDVLNQKKVGEEEACKYSVEDM